MEGSANQVVNAHWFGGVEKLPSNTIYVGRPSPYGNPYSSKTGHHTREECIALHRIDLYQSLTTDSLFFSRLKSDLLGHDLACWCKQQKRIVGCHGDNYLHVLSPRLIERTYDKTVIHYLMDDLRYLLGRHQHIVEKETSQDDFLPKYWQLGDLRLGIQTALQYCKDNDVSPEEICFLVARLCIDLELALLETKREMVDYRFEHALWETNRFVSKVPDIFPAPSLPGLLVKPKNKG